MRQTEQSPRRSIADLAETADPDSQLSALRTEAIAQAGLAQISAPRENWDKARNFAAVVLEIFNDYHLQARRIPWLAKRAFETRDWRRSVSLSQERIALFSTAVTRATPVLNQALRDTGGIGGFWNTAEEQFRRLVADRYEADLALAFLASLRRQIYQDTWVPVAYDQLRVASTATQPSFLRDLPAGGVMTEALVEEMLAALSLNAPFRDLCADAAAVARRINEELSLGGERALTSVEVVEAGFFRNRGAYLVGGLRLDGQELSPLALALNHAPEGIYVDAVILRETTLRHIFSSTLANFHVPITGYHALVDFLVSLMPSRPRGLHYSTVGYNHVGKVAVMDQITAGLERSGERLQFAPGHRGSVAIAFTAPATGYVLKVIRNKPTENYKWDVFDGVPAVLAKYRNVHEINRSGSMLDNIIYSNATMAVGLFGEAVLEELMEAACETVTRYRDEVFFRHLIVQRKQIPVPLYLERCDREAAETVVVRLGQCIRNNAASNVFNRDLDGRNYGVSSLRFVHLFDYDAVEVLTEVKVRTNLDREPGEEDIPDWFFEEGPVFLPEELEAHLRLPRDLRRLFREAHGELLTVEYWTRMQRLLRDGGVPRVRTYPRSTQLEPPEAPRSVLGHVLG
ncbi:MAG: isocitrate dehydrogenase kinase/phosphatase AceK regulatory subunit [Pseudomonadota bacterium]